MSSRRTLGMRSPQDRIRMRVRRPRMRRRLSGFSVNRMVPNVLTLLALCAGMTAISFAVARAAVLYLWTMSQLHSIGWAIVLFFAVCCALRLARFNTQLGAEPPPYAAAFFTGAPAPAGAGLLLLPMFVSFEWGDWIP